MNPVNPPSDTGLPPQAIALAGRLFDAARRGDEQSVALLTAAVERGGAGLANLTNDKGDSLIMLSAYHGHTPIVRLLLSHGADPNRLNDRGQSPLAGVVFKNERDCVLALLAGGADPELGEPSAMGACEVFKQEEYKSLFLDQIEKLRGGRSLVNGNGLRHGNDYGDEYTNGGGNGHGHGHGNGNGMNGNGNEINGHGHENGYANGNTTNGHTI